MAHTPAKLYFSFDLDMPVECDDEYWTSPDPDQAFRQPEGKPSTVCYFTLYLKLIQIHAFALRTIVSFAPEMFTSLMFTYIVFAVFDQQIKGFIGFRRPAMGTTYRFSARLSSQQMGRLCT